MRATLTLISLLTLSSTAAFAQWEVRPAPSSWGVPQYSPPVRSQPVRSQPIRSQPVPVQAVQPQAPVAPLANQTTNLPANLNDAVGCSAALQIATMAAPSWAGERGITSITNAWLQKVFALGEPQGIAGDKIPGLVEAEMQRQIEGAANDPARLSRQAFECASRQP